MAWLYSRQAAKQSQTNKSKIKGFSPTQISWLTSIRTIYGYHKSSTGWWYTYPSENDGVRQLGLSFPTEWKNKSHVPKHQTV